MPQRRKIFSKLALSQIQDFVRQGVRPAEIAARLGCKIGSLRVRCSEHGISLRSMGEPMTGRRLTPRRRLSVQLPPGIALQLEQRAGTLGMSSNTFASTLLSRIVEDNLFDAVIDELDRA